TRPMPIDYRRLVDGLSAHGDVPVGGATGLTAIDAVVSTAQEATGALGATYTELSDSGGRVVAACGVMAWALGQPVAADHADEAALSQSWGESLAGRGVRSTLGHPVRASGRRLGAVHLYFADPDAAADPELRPVLALVAATAAQVHGEPERVTGVAAAEDDRALFLAVAGHELRTPVTVVKGYAHMLADRWESLRDDDRREAARVLAARADELARLVDRLLGASVGDSSEGWLVRTVPFDPVEAMRRAANQLPADVRDRVELELPSSLPPASGDPVMLTAVVSELVTNAVRSTSTGQAPTVQLEAGADAGTVFVRVCDRGAGIDPAHVERAFERFWRARTDEDGRGGVGLGLYLVRRLVERQNGWVSLRPRDGGGTVAEVRLRRADVAPPPLASGEA
ncbi:MAG: HAMP domain-containing histidine kinase, partial [Sporichthyaceae bacterium]|nr:HAMP domain-containing histidine kinase [Sporichthyaceae bacterium]